MTGKAKMKIDGILTSVVFDFIITRTRALSGP